VGGGGGMLLQTPKVVITTPRKAGIENISSYKRQQGNIILLFKTLLYGDTHNMHTGMLPVCYKLDHRPYA